MAKKTAQPRPPKKNAAAQSMAKLRWQGTTPEERSTFMSRVSKAGWQGKLAQLRIKAGGRPPDPDRCPCGAMTAARAAKRKHRCTAQ